ncbi:MAG: hypothetical protein WD595_05240, partial [Waddliaceae bacterium]
SPFDWRKANHKNFIIDSFRSIQELRNSNMSDRRDTFLAHLFWRFHQEWAFEGRTRIGWDRNPALLPPNNKPYPGETENQNNYVEYELNLHAKLQSTWHLTLSYRHRMAEPKAKSRKEYINDDRFALYFSIGLDRPCESDMTCSCPLLDF